MSLKLVPAVGSALFLIMSCTSSGPVTTQLDYQFWQSRERPQPEGYQSPVDAIEGLASLRPKKSFPELGQLYVGIAKTLLAENERISDELATTEELKLKSGHSYDFNLESFCVHAGSNRPIDGDGFYPGNLDPGSQKWLPQILEKYSQAQISQEKTQTLIWGLLSGSKFDQLSGENQSALLKIFPDAAVRFGNSEIEAIAKSQLSSWLQSKAPESVVAGAEGLNTLRDKFLSLQNSYSDLERNFAPQSSRSEVNGPHWVEMPEGYFLKLTSRSYSKVNVKIYVPENSKSGVLFHPSTILAMPGQGQRLALSAVLTRGNISSTADKYLSEILKKYPGVAINPLEAGLILDHPMDALKIYHSMERAFEMANKNFPSEGAHNNRVDGYRHFIWSGLSSHAVGETRAKEFLDAHEENPAQPAAEKEMDLHNNQIGRDAAKKIGSGDNFEAILTQAAFKALKEGRLKVLK